jgi:hypothetical protein
MATRLLPYALLYCAATAAAALGCNFGSSSTVSVEAGVFDAPASGSPGALKALVTTESFGTVAIGSKSAPVDVMIANAGGGPTGMIVVQLGGADAASFAIDSDTCSGRVLGAAATCVVRVHFAPRTAANLAATLTATAAPGGIASVSLAGQGAQAGPLSVAPSQQDFATVGVGTKSAPATFAFTNGGSAPTGPLTVSLTGSDAASYQLTDPCSGKPLGAGASCQVTVAFAPATIGSKTATLAGTTSDAGTATASLTGTAAAGAAFAVTPATYDFGSTPGGTATAAASFTVTNTGGVPSGTPSIAVTGANAGDFTVSQSTCTAALAAAAKCTFAVTFKPTTTAAESATATVSATGTTSGTASLSGTGLAPAAIALSPATVTFGSVLQGHSSPDQTVTLTNGGGVTTGPLAVSLGGTNAGAFAVDADTCTGATLAPMGTCTIAARFSPPAGLAGSVQGTLDVTGNPGGATAAMLTGVALAPASLTITPPSEPFGTWAWDMMSPATQFTVTNAGDVSTGVLTATLGGASSQDFAISSDQCTRQTLAAKASCTVSAQFAPQGNPLGSLSATLTVGDGAAAVGAALSATSVQEAALGIAPPAGFTGFGAVPLNMPVTATFTVTNAGAVATGTLATSVVGSTEYTLVGDQCSGKSLAASAMCTVGVAFDPTVAGAAPPAQLELTATPGGPASYALSGSGATPALSIGPSSWSAALGACPSMQYSQNFTVTNVGNAATTSAVTANLSGAQSTAFTVQNGCAGTLAQGASCVVTVTFACPSSDPLGYEGIGTLGVSAGGAASQTASLDVGAGVSISPNVATFGGVALAPGTSYAQTFTLTNFGSTATKSINGLGATGSTATAYTASDTNCVGNALGAYGSGSNTCSFNVTYTAPTPGSPGTDQDTLVVSCFQVCTFACTCRLATGDLAASEK